MSEIKLSVHIRDIKTITGLYILVGGNAKKPRMTGINLDRELKGNASAQAYTFAIRTSRHANQKLQKSMLLANAQK